MTTTSGVHFVSTLRSRKESVKTKRKEELKDGTLCVRVEERKIEIERNGGRGEAGKMGRG